MRITPKAEPQGTLGLTAAIQSQGQSRKRAPLCIFESSVVRLSADADDETFIIGKPASPVKLDTCREFVRIALPSIS